MKTYGELADFLERLLNDELNSPYEIDEFECLPFARKQGQPRWHLECWRRCIIDVAGVKQPPERHWMHPDARPFIEKILEVIRYVDESEKIRNRGRIGLDEK